MEKLKLGDTVIIMNLTKGIPSRKEQKITHIGEYIYCGHDVYNKITLIDVNDKRFQIYKKK